MKPQQIRPILAQATSCQRFARFLLVAAAFVYSLLFSGFSGAMSLKMSLAASMLFELSVAAHAVVCHATMSHETTC
jgi:hypothetical protein